MANILGNALWILRVLQEEGTMLPDITARQLKDKTGLDDISFESADTYLLQAKYVQGTFGGLNGKRWLTPAGVEFLETQMSQRIQLSIMAEKIARLLFTKPQNKAGISQIQKTLEIDENNCLDAARELIDEEFAEDMAPETNVARLTLIGLTPEGRKAIRNNFIRHQPAISQHNVGAVFYGPVSDSNVLSVAQAHQSRIQQVIDNKDIAALRDEIDQLLKQTVNAVKEELTATQLAVYERAVEELGAEIHKDKPNSSVLQKCLNIIPYFCANRGGFYCLLVASRTISYFGRISPVQTNRYWEILELPKPCASRIFGNEVCTLLISEQYSRA